MKKKILALFMAVSVFMTSGSVAFAAEEINTEEVPACGTEETTDWAYDVLSENEIMLTEYKGTDIDIEIPSSIDGKYVTKLQYNLFKDNTAIKSVSIPATVYYMGGVDEVDVFIGASSLHDIYVEEGNPIYYDEDGVLFRYGASSGLPMIIKYPEGRDESTYIIPDDTNYISKFAFHNCSNLKKIVVPSSVATVMLQGFDRLTDGTIVFQQTDPSQIDLVDAFYLLKNCRIIVKNQDMKEAVVVELDDCTNTTVKTESELTEAERANYLTPATDLTFSDGSEVKNVTLMPEPLAKNWWDENNLPPENEDDYYWQDIYYTVSPEYSTDIVTWTSSNSDIAVAKSVNGRSVVMGFSEGNCTITGTTESGRGITLNVVVAIPIKNMVFESGDYYERDNLNNGQTITYDYDTVQNEWGGRIYFNASAEFETPYSGYNRKPKVTETITGDKDKLVYTPEHRINGAGEEWYDNYLTVKGTGSVQITETALAPDGSTLSWTYTIAVKKTDNNSNTGTDSSQNNGSNTENNHDTNTGNNTENNHDTNTGNNTDSNSGNNSSTNGNSDSGNTTVKPATKASQKITNVSSSYKKAYKTSFTLKPKAKTTCTYKSSNTKIATVSSKGKVTIKGTGKVTITITAKETSRYKKATKKVTIYAIPAKMKTPTVKAGSKKLTVSWKKDSRADGCQIQYSTSSKFKNAKTVTCSKKTVKKTIKKLKSGKKYYVRIRAYKKIGGKKYDGSYSKGKSVKVK